MLYYSLFHYQYSAHNSASHQILFQSDYLYYCLITIGVQTTIDSSYKKALYIFSSNYLPIRPFRPFLIYIPSLVGLFVNLRPLKSYHSPATIPYIFTPTSYLLYIHFLQIFVIPIMIIRF